MRLRVAKAENGTELLDEFVVESVDMHRCLLSPEYAVERTSARKQKLFEDHGLS